MNLPALIGTLAPNKSRGAALIIMLFVVVLASTAIFVSLLAKTNPEIERQKKTMAALAQAKQALIAWSVTRGDMQPATTTETVVETAADGTQSTVVNTKYTYYRPGSLPCPNLDSEKPGSDAGSCSVESGKSLRRLPWRSLGLEELVDGYSEPLWYVVSDNFRRANTLNNYAINNETRGSLLLYASDGVTLLTPSGEELAAIIFAPGPPLPSNTDRGTKPNDASSYLEAFNGKNNANAAGPFIMGPVRDSEGNLISNDIAIGISAKELITAIEQRALKEAEKALAAYKTENGRYPYPAPYNGANCVSVVDDVTKAIPSLCNSDSATPTCIGRLPENIFPYYSPADARLLELSGQLKIAPWFTQNGWGRTMTYAINDGIGSAARCPTPIGIDGTKKYNTYILIAPGTARTRQSRPPPITQQNSPDSLSNYLEDTGNTDAWSGNFDFVTPTANSNDRLRSAP